MQGGEVVPGARRADISHLPLPCRTSQLPLPLRSTFELWGQSHMARGLDQKRRARAKSSPARLLSPADARLHLGCFRQTSRHAASPEALESPQPRPLVSFWGINRGELPHVRFRKCSADMGRGRLDGLFMQLLVLSCHGHCSHSSLMYAPVSVCVSHLTSGRREKKQ